MCGYVSVCACVCAYVCACVCMRVVDWQSMGLLGTISGVDAAWGFGRGECRVRDGSPAQGAIEGGLVG